MKLDVEKIDRYMRRQNVDTEGIIWNDPGKAPFRVSGFYWFDKEGLYQRFPEKTPENIREPVVRLSRCTAGGQLRFRSDSCRVLLAVKSMESKAPSNMTEIACSCFDLYVGDPGYEQFWNVSNSPRKEDMTLSELYRSPEKEIREFCLNFPLYNGVSEVWIGLEKGATIQPPTPRRFTHPIVIYGTSITQGGCASRPGMCFTNQLSRRLQTEFLNFGFSGQGQNDPEVAELIAGVRDPAMFIIDSEANSISGRHVLERVPRFLDILRKKHPKVPVVILTKVKYGPRYAEELPSLKKEFRKVFRARQAAGDDRIFFIDASAFWRGDYWENTVDGAHPNDLGFTRMADKLEGKLLSLLELYGSETP